MQKGFCLPSCLIVLSLLGLLAAWIAFSSNHILLSTANELHSRLSKEQATAKVLESYIEDSSFKKKLVNCLNAEAKHGSFKINRQLCALNGVVNTGLPLFNYNLLFANAEPCSKNSPSCRARISQGKALSLGSLCSLNECASEELQNSKVFSFIGNIETSENVNLQDLNTDKLSSAGFINLSGSLITNSNSLIVAAGDIYIEHLASNTSAALTVTLVSASGKIHIGSLSPQIKLYALAKNGMNFSNSEQFLSQPQLPSPINSEVFILTANKNSRF